MKRFTATEKWDDRNMNEFEDGLIEAREAELQHTVFTRCDWKCQTCGRRDWLELYIIGWQPGEQVTDFVSDDLIALCPKCFDKGEPI